MVKFFYFSFQITHHVQVKIITLIFFECNYWFLIQSATKRCNTLVKVYIILLLYLYFIFISLNHLNYINFSVIVHKTNWKNIANIKIFLTLDRFLSRNDARKKKQLMWTQKHWHKNINLVTTLNRGEEFPSTFFSSTQKIQAGKIIQHFKEATMAQASNNMWKRKKKRENQETRTCPEKPPIKPWKWYPKREQKNVLIIFSTIYLILLPLTPKSTCGFAFRTENID